MTQTIRFCKICGYPTTHPYGLFVTESGCSGCEYHLRKQEINWDERFSNLREISKNNPRCILVVDSNPKSFYSLEKLLSAGFQVVCTSFNSLLNTQEGLANFAKLRNSFDVEFLTYSQDLLSTQEIIRETLLLSGNVMWHANAGQRLFAIRTAQSRGITRIFYPEHKGNEQTGMFNIDEFPEMTFRSWVDHDLSQVDCEKLVKSTTLRQEALDFFTYPEEVIFGNSELIGSYVSHYFFWDSVEIHDYVSQKYNLSTNNLSRFCLNSFEDIDTIANLTYHNYLKMLKFGYTAKLDQRVQWVRNNHSWGSLLNDESLKDEFSHDDFLQFADWLDAPIDALLLAAERFINKEIWERIDLRYWISRIPGDTRVIDHSRQTSRRPSNKNSIYGK